MPELIDKEQLEVIFASGDKDAIEQATFSHMVVYQNYVVTEQTTDLAREVLNEYVRRGRFRHHEPAPGCVESYTLIDG